jgi:hypothetical protein
MSKPKPLTPTMTALLKKASADWTRLPVCYGCTNATVCALERRGLVELRIAPGSVVHREWRWTAAGEAYST